MSTKNEVLALLFNHPNEYLSGQVMAEQLHVSRGAIWKAIKALEKDGYSIEAITNKGYSLKNNQDILSKEGIEKYLTVECDLHVEEEVTSTNAILVKKATEGEKEGYILIAGKQTKGKGRVGHTFYSPRSSGIYMSILLRPALTPMEATNITSMAAVSACEAIEKVGVKAEIKWINDIFVDKKKCCGILTEAAISMETKMMDYVVMGIGLNVYEPDGGFPEDIQNIAGSILKERRVNGRNELAGYFINSFMNYYHSFNKKEYYDAYKEHSMVLGKEVTVTMNGKLKKVFAKDIDENFELIIIDDGVEKTVSSGEVHIKL